MKNFIAILFVALTVLSPPLKLAPGVPSIRPEFIVLTISLLFGQFKLNFDDRISRLLFGFMGVAFVAILMSYTIFGVSYYANDLSIFPMLIQYWLIYCFWKGIANSEVSRSVTSLVAVIISIAAIIGIAQKFNISGVNDWLTPLYMNLEIHMVNLKGLRNQLSFGRATGTVGDPRHYAYLLAVGVSAGLAWLLHQRKFTFLTCVFSVLICLSIVASYFCQSRTGLMAIGLQFAVGSMLFWRRTGNPVIPAAVASAVSLGLFLSWSRFSDESSMDSRLFMSVGEAVETSGYARIRDFLEPFKKSLENPLILITGMGPSKSVLPGSEHGEMGWVTLRYGLVGLYIYLAILYFTIRRVIYLYQKVRSRIDAAMVMTLLSVMSIWCFYWLAESVFKLPQLMSLNMMVVGLAFGFNPQTRDRRSQRLDSRKTVSFQSAKSREFPVLR